MPASPDHGLCSELSRVLPHPAGASQPGSGRALPQGVKKQTGFQCPALSSLQGAEGRQVPTSSQNALRWKCLGGCTGEGVEDVLGHQVNMVNSLLP